MLYQTGEPYLIQFIPPLVASALALSAVTGVLLWKITRARRRKPEGPLDKLLGRTGRVTEAIAPDRPGKVQVYGEIWEAGAGGDALPLHAAVEVVALEAVEPVRLIVKRVSSEEERR